MCIKTIVVPVTGSADDEALLTTAFAAARPFSAHVSALYVHPDPRQAMPYFGMPVTPEVMQEIIDNAEELAQAAARSARATVASAAKKADIDFTDDVLPADHVTCSFRIAYGQLGAVLLVESRLADLVVLGRSLREDLPDLHDAFIDLLMKSHRPVLMTPAQPVTDLLVHVAVGWDGGAAASHALRAAVPLLKKAAKVTLYQVKTEALGGHVSLDHPRTYLKLHGVTANCREIAPTAAGPGATLLDVAARDGASLLVAGGYGHSRLTETLFGGTTIDLTTQDQVPMFLMH